MKHAVAYILILSLLLALPVTAAAQSIELPNNQGQTLVTAVIPDIHTITLSGSNVQLSYDGMLGTQVLVPRHSEPDILLVPDPGFEVRQVLFGGQDITASYKNGTVTLPKVSGDETLTVVTQTAGPVDRTEISGTVLDKDGKPVSGAAVTIHNPGATATTGSGGGYTFQNVPIGANTLTVTLPDGTTGTVSISVVEGDTLTVTHDNGIYTIVLPKGAAGLNMGLSFSAQGGLTIASVSAHWPYFAAFGENPRTGDIIRFWIAALTLSGLGLLGAWLYLKKRPKDEI